MKLFYLTAMSEIRCVDDLQHISDIKLSAFLKGKCGNAKTVKSCLTEKYSAWLQVLIQMSYN